MFELKDFYVLIAAFAGAVIGGIFTLIAGYFQNKRVDKQIEVQKEIATKQIRAEIILSHEQNSINELRDLIAKYMSLWQEFTHKIDTERGRISKDYYEATMRDVSNLSHKILLILNIDDIQEKALYDAIQSSVIGISKVLDPGGIEALGFVYEAIGEDTQTVLKNRLKSVYSKI